MICHDSRIGDDSSNVVTGEASVRKAQTVLHSKNEIPKTMPCLLLRSVYAQSAVDFRFLSC